MNTPALYLHNVTVRLQDARERVARGWPSIALALAGNPTSKAKARLEEATAARYAEGKFEPWVLVLTEAMALVDEAREMWGTTPDAMPPMTVGLAPCGMELRLHLATARATSEKAPAWEDPGGLTRTQALCVVHLTVCLAQWRMQEQRAEAAMAKAEADRDAEARQRAAAAARVIWAQPQPNQQPTHEPGPRSLRDWANVSSAFNQWEDEDE